MSLHRLPRFALLATAAVLGSKLPAVAQTVQMFEQAPSLEQLRSIMVPESRGGASRRIVITRPDMPAGSDPIQQASMHEPATPAPAPAQAPLPAPIAAPAPAPIPVAMSIATPIPRPAPPVARPSPPAPARLAAAPHRPEPVAEAGIVGFRINFALDSDAIEPAYRIFIERIGALMKEEPQVKLRIEGHTDATGPDDYNLGLSTRRGVAVAAYLVDRMGIDPDRLVVAGKGKTEPMTADPYDPRNRRVQFVRVQ